MLNQIVLENESIYYQYRNMLTSTQWKVLKAMAIEEKTEKPFSKSFLKKHKLNSSSIVKRSLDALINKDLIFHNIMQKQAYYEIQDKFLMRWLQYKK